MNEADRIMTSCLLKAERSITPSRKAMSHPWSPGLVLAQRKKGLLSNLLAVFKSTNLQFTPRIERRFRRNAKAMDSEWEISVINEFTVQTMSHAINREVKRMVHQAAKLRKQHLEERREAMFDNRCPEDKEMALDNLIRRERVRYRHRAIKKRLKQGNAPLTFIIDADGIRKTDSEMVEAMVVHNTKHFEQARTNGASAAQKTPFADSLRSYRTSQEEVLQNMEEILSGKLDTSNIHETEQHFYNALRRVSAPIEEIGVKISPCAAKSYYNDMREIQSLVSRQDATWGCIRPCVQNSMMRLPRKNKRRSCGGWLGP